MSVQRNGGSGRRALSSSGRVIALAAAFVLLGYGGLVTFANHPAATMSNATTLAGAAVAASGNPADAATKSNELPTAAAAVDMQNDPRECDAVKGITSNCVFE